MIKKYAKKLSVIEAVQYNGNNFYELQEFAGNHVYLDNRQRIYVHTSKGEMKMKNKVGDYLVRLNENEFCFFERKAFEDLYEELDNRKYACLEFMY